jgi:hypothetical protein
MALAGAVDEAQMQTCQVQCGQALAACERERPRGAFCPREFQSCKEQCAAPPRDLLVDRRGHTHQLCVQRCDVSASLCEQGARQTPGYCTAGAERCKARC